MNRSFLLITLLLNGFVVAAQYPKVFGRVTNADMEPLAFASVQVKELQRGVLTKEDGTYEITLGEGKFDLVISMVGYKTQVITVFIGKENYRREVVMEAGGESELSEVMVMGKMKDRAEEYVRNLIRNKESIQAAAGAYSCRMYIKAAQEDSVAEKQGRKKKKSHAPPKPDSISEKSKQIQEMNRMALAEIVLNLDYGGPGKIREERTGVTKKGNTSDLYFMSATEGDFNFYNNLIKVPQLSETVFLSPFSYSGLMAYRYKTIATEEKNGEKFYVIAVRPRQLSNATVEGEITIAEKDWNLVHVRFSFPKYHLPQYDFFEVEQDFRTEQDSIWVLARQEFTYYAKNAKRKLSGRTVVAYKEYELNKIFDNKHFGTELSATSQKAYEQDSSFWKGERTEPLTEKELGFIRYKDSVYQATHTKEYLDSVDRVTNKITWQNIAYKGQTFNNHEKERRWYLPALPNLINPFSFGGTRVSANFFYSKTFPSRKNVSIWNNISYGLRNKDVNGSISLNRMYNPFNRGFYNITVGRQFNTIFAGDAWINQLKRSNVYLDNSLGLRHGLELKNGLFLYTHADMAFRRSVSDYKTNDLVDTLLGNVLQNNQAIAFQSYNALYATLRLTYTPFQKYLREPKEKIILGSTWPTAYVQWRKGVSGVFNSKVDFDYLEFGIQQEVQMGILGSSSYTLKSGSFLNTRDVRLVDYKFQRQGDPFLFMNPHIAFQALDSSFALFDRFYEGHYVHEFNGALLNKIPLFKKIGLRETGGAGFLVAPERNLRYAEAFAGVERVFKAPFNVLGKFKIGVYVVGSVANQYRNPVQFKLGITTWDVRAGKWR